MPRLSHDHGRNVVLRMGFIGIILTFEPESDEAAMRWLNRSSIPFPRLLMTTPMAFLQAVHDLPWHLQEWPCQFVLSTVLHSSPRTGKAKLRSPHHRKIKEKMTNCCIQLFWISIALWMATKDCLRRWQPGEVMLCRRSERFADVK